MRILTTSDLAYVSGSNGIDSATGSFGDPNNYGASSGSSGTNYSADQNQEYVDGVLMGVDNPLGYGLGVLRNLYNCYKNSSSFRGMSVTQIATAIASGCTE
jgi:hypothetical protein